MNYKAVLFDLDGTLTNSGPGITRSVQYALEKLGRPEPDLDKLRVFVGPPLMEQFMSYAGLSQEEGRLAVDYYRERYVPTGLYENEVYPGVPEMLERLYAAGLRLAVASSKPETLVREVLRHFSLEHWFEVIVGSELDGRRTAKSEVVEEALLRLGLSEERESVIMVGDREHDVIGAREAGLDCIAITYGYGSREELEAASPLSLAETPQAVADFFA